MITTTTTAAPSFDLVAVKDVLEELGIDEGDETSITRTSKLISRASDRVRRMTRRKFAQERVTETVRGYGDTILQLERRPVVEVHTITFDGDPITDFDFHDADAGQLFRRAGWIYTNTWQHHFIERAPVPNGEEKRYTVDYTGGYRLPTFPSSWTAPTVPPALPTQDLPQDIQEFTIELIKALHFSAERDPTVASERIGDYSVTYGGQSSLAAAEAAFVARWGSLL